MPEIIRVPPGLGYYDGSYGKKQTKNGGKIAGAVSTEKARLRREANSRNAKIGAMKKKIYGTKNAKAKDRSH